MLYSTCTFSREENEGTISWLLKEFPEMELLPMEGYEGFDGGRPQWGDGNSALTRCVRIWPHKMDGEGHFLALLEKRPEAEDGTGKAAPAALQRLDKKSRQLLEEFFRGSDFQPLWDRIEIRGGKVYQVPELPRLPGGLRFLRNGLLMGEIRKDRFEPSQQLAMAIPAGGYPARLSLSPEDERIERYLRGETILAEGEATVEQGWILVCVDEYPLGWGKLVKGLVKNKYAAGWRKN